MHPRALLDSLDVGVVAINPDWTVEEWTATAARIAGVPAESVVGRDFWTVFPAARAPHAEQLLHEVLDDGQPRSFVLPASATAPAGVTYEVRAARAPDSRLVLGFRPVKDALTPESRAAQLVSAFEAERRLYALLFETLPTPALILTGEGEIIEANPLAADLLGAGEPARLRGRRLAEWVAPVQEGQFGAALRAARERQQRLDLTLDVVGDTPREVKAVLVDVDRTAKTPTLLFVAVDVSREALLQRKLLAADRLSQLGALVAGVAHELSNPLAAIAAFADNLAAGLRDGELRASAEIIHTEALRAGRVIGTLLDFARQRPRVRQALDLRDLAERVFALEKRALANARVAATVDIADDVPPIEGDPQELQQVLLNAVINALQAIAGTGRSGQIRVTARRNNSHVMLTVADSGPGVPPQLLDRVFDPFFTTKGEQGSGLGLSISSGLVRAMGGRMWMQNVEGGGACLFVELPEAEGAERPALGTPERQHAEHAMRLLLVEDDPSVRRGIALMAKRLGHDVTSAATAGEARRLLDAASQRYDALLLDVHLDEAHTGFELFELLESEGQGRERRIVFTTGDSMSSQTRTHLERAARPVLRKPFSLDDLRQVLDRVGGETMES